MKPHQNSKSTRSVILALVLFCALQIVISQAIQAQTFTVLHNFTGASDGANPALLTMDAAGNLYGPAVNGGDSPNCEPGLGCGNLFRLAQTNSGWVLTPFYTFYGANGGNQTGALVFGPGGMLYGASNGVYVYSLRPGGSACKSAICSWTQNIFYQLTSYSGGQYPDQVMFDARGNLYGVAGASGGGNCYEGCGTIYELKQAGGSWTQMVLWTFQGGPSDGALPNSIVFDDGGNIFGTTTLGGTYGYGTVFELSPSGDGWTEHILYNFANQGEAEPVGPLVFDQAGNLYGATSGYQGSDPRGSGTVFQLTPSSGGWTFSTIYTFNGTGGPAAGLTLHGNGNLYGTTYYDGAYGQGAVFKLTRGNNGWQYSSLYDFSGNRDGQNPQSNVLFDAAGNLYGTTFRGGQDYQGMVWKITP